MFTLLQLVAFGILFTINFDIIKSMTLVTTPEAKFTPLPDDARRCFYSPGECDDVTVYPTEHVKSLVAKNKLRKDAFIIAQQSAESAARENSTVAPASETDEGQSDGFKTFCSFQETLVFPKIGLVEEGGSVNALFIIQVDDESDYNQGVLIERCLPGNDGKKCDRLQAANLNTTCVTKYGSIRLWTLNRHTGNPEMAPIILPTACICKYHDPPENFSYPSYK